MLNPSIFLQAAIGAAVFDTIYMLILSIIEAAMSGPTALAYTQTLLSWRLAHEDQTLTHMMATDKGMIARPSARF